MWSITASSRDCGKKSCTAFETVDPAVGKSPLDQPPLSKHQRHLAHLLICEAVVAHFQSWHPPDGMQLSLLESRQDKSRDLLFMMAHY